MGFRYQAIEFNPLAKTTLIRDLVALTLALCQPADRLSWLATLRAPYIGLELADMESKEVDPVLHMDNVGLFLIQLQSPLL